MARNVEAPGSPRPPRTAGSLGEALHDAEGGPSVPGSEVVPVVQVVEELVQLQTLLEARGSGDLAVVGRVEGTAEAPEHAGDCQLILRVAVERSRVKNDRPSGVLGYVSCPEVPVKQGWDDVQVTEQVRDLQLQGANASAKQPQGAGGTLTLSRLHTLGSQVRGTHGHPTSQPPVWTQTHSGRWWLQGTVGTGNGGAPLTCRADHSSRASLSPDPCSTMSIWG